MSFGTRLKEKREALGITQPQLANMLNVSKGAIGNWETDVNSPRATLLYDLFEILQCDANFLFQDETKELYKNEATPEEFENIVKKYRDLDDSGKKHIRYEIEREAKRVASLDKRDNRIKELETLQSTVIEFPSHLEVNAACPDNDSTPEERTAGDAIMTDDSEWE